MEISLVSKQQQQKKSSGYVCKQYSRFSKAYKNRERVLKQEQLSPREWCSLIWCNQPHRHHGYTIWVCKIFADVMMAVSYLYINGLRGCERRYSHTRFIYLWKATDLKNSLEFCVIWRNSCQPRFSSRPMTSLFHQHSNTVTIVRLKPTSLFNDAIEDTD